MLKSNLLIVSLLLLLLNSQLCISRKDDTCGMKFGCFNQFCYSECKSKDIFDLNTAEVNKKPWCYTSNRPDRIDFVSCQHDSDCSDCWPCISNCS